MASTYLTRTNGTPTGTTKGTLSFWLKRAKLTVGDIFVVDGRIDASNRFKFAFNSNDVIEFWNTNGGSNTFLYISTAKYRDVSAWYHIVLSIDTTQATAGDRVKIYVNGTQVTSFSSSTNPSLNDANTVFFESGASLTIGAYNNGSGYILNFDGSLAHFHYTDGTAYDASTFGETDANGVWKPKTSPSVTYGTNGFFLKFENSGSMGTDSSGNGNNFTVNGNLTQTLDTPSNVYCTLNALDNYFYNATFSNGNTTVTTPSTGFTYGTTTMGVGKGKWYIESKYISNSGGDYTRFGIAYKPSTSTTDNLGNSTGQAVYRPDGSIVVNGTETASWGSSWTTSDIISIALDCDNSKLYFAKNGVWQNSSDPSAGTGGISITDVTTLSTGNYFFGLSDNNNGGSATWSYNFGNGYFGTAQISSAGSNGNGSIFEYDVPTGFYALNTKNLATYG